MNQTPANARFLFTPPASEMADAKAKSTVWLADHAGRHALLLRFIALNMAAVALLVAAWGQGWLHLVTEADSTGLTFVIIAVFAAGFIFCIQRVIWLDREIGLLNDRGTPAGSLVADYLDRVSGHEASSRQLSAAAARLKISAEIAIVRHFANSLVLLGLIGTVAGFIIALSGVNADAVQDLKAVSPMVSRLLAGMSVALYTTLVGGALNLWLSVNHNLLSKAGATLFTRLIDLGEADAGPRTV
ncbi:MAG: MotA/TolQ/ExbB proton channel family protein [Alphaproteobacteria bacterium]|nr:MotA/TolQ/ExbB proton channel family protein [Alphaproteobacteria bacterium]